MAGRDSHWTLQSTPTFVDPTDGHPELNLRGYSWSFICVYYSSCDDSSASSTDLQSTDVVLPTDDGRELRLRCVVRPDAAQAARLDRLGLKLPERLRIRSPLVNAAEM